MADTVQVRLNNGNISTVRVGSPAYETYKNSIVSGATTSSATQHNIANNQARQQGNQLTYTAPSPSTTNNTSQSNNWSSSSSSSSSPSYSSSSSPSTSSYANTTQGSSYVDKPIQSITQSNNNAQLQAQQEAQRQAQLKAQQDATNKSNYLNTTIGNQVANSGNGIGGKQFATVKNVTPTNANRSGIVYQVVGDNGNIIDVNHGSLQYDKYVREGKIQPVNNAPGVNQNATANFNGSNWDDYSGVRLGDVDNQQMLTNAQATGLNPLHLVNAQRQNLLNQANSTGNYDGLNAWEAKQTPLWYDMNEQGQMVQNKNYYANLAQSSLRAMEEAQSNGDTFIAGEWERNLKEQLQKYNAAPGQDISMAKINSSDDYAKQYGVARASDEFFNSQFNNNNVLTTGMANPQYWTQNAVFQDNPGALQSALQLSNTYGSEAEQAQRQAINLEAMQAYLNPVVPTAPVAPVAPVLSSYNPSYSEPVAETPVLPPVTAVQAPTDYLNHIYAPGSSANTNGYIDNQLVDNDAFQRYLKNILTGGF